MTVNNEEELKEQVKKLQLQLSRSKRDKATLERMIPEGDKMMVFLDKQVQSRDARITIVELQLSKKKTAKEESKKDKEELGLNMMQIKQLQT